MKRRPVQYFARMPNVLRSYALSGLTSNDDFARVLQSHFDERITPKDVARWRNQHFLFDQAIVSTLDRANAEITDVVYEAARGGDLPTARWWQERRNPAFMPKSKVENTNRESLADNLTRRSLSEDELRERGLIYDDDADE